MSYETIEFKLEAGVARITLNRPERLNAFNIRMHTDVADALSQIEENATTRVLLLTGTGRAFCAGQDLSERDVNAGPLDLGQSTIDDEAFDLEVERMVDRLAHAPTMSLAASKHAIRGAWCATLDEQLEIERALQRKCGLSEDYKEGVSAFKARRTPNFTGR